MFERRNDPVLIDLPMSAGAASFDYFRSTMESDMASLTTLREVVENLGMTEGFKRKEDGTLTDASKRRRDSLARSLGVRLSIGRRSPNRQMDIIAVTYTGPDPAIGPKLVDEVKRVYIRRTMAWVREFLERQREYFSLEAAKAGKELKAAQRESTLLHLDNPYANPRDPAMLSTTLSQLQMEQRGLQLRKREYEAELSSLCQMRATIVPAMEDSLSEPESNGEQPARNLLSVQAQRLQSGILKLDRRIDDLRSTRGMRDAHPEVQELLVKRLRLQRAFEDQRHEPDTAAVSNRPSKNSLPALTPFVDSGTAPINRELARLNVRIDSQKSKIEEIGFSLTSNEEALRQLRNAKDNLFQNRDAFDEVESRVRKARQRHGKLESVVMSIEPAINAISQDRLMQFNEGQPARGSTRPVSPKANVVVLLSILAGIAAGIAVVILSEVLDRVYRSSGQVARSLGLPILEAIDEIVIADDRRRLLIRRVVLAPLLVIGLVGTAGLTGSMAYLSIHRPATYQRLKAVPATAAKVLGVEVSSNPSPDTDKGS